MTMMLYAHPFASYCQKALIALYEKRLTFEYRRVGQPGEDGAMAELRQLWPFGKFPVLVDDGRPLIEASIIIEHLDLHYPGPVRLIPEQGDSALEVRFWDRFFDNYVHAPMQAIVGDALRPDGQHDPVGVRQSRETLEIAYAWLEKRLAGREWVCGDGFSLADCAAAPALFYADWGHPIADGLPEVRAYRARLNARPSFARAIDEARPYRSFFPLGAPDRD